MLKTRVIPCLLLRKGGWVKTFQFDKPKYVGDSLNAVRIFNEKKVDEIVIFDITATPEKREPNFDLIKDLASQAFMTLAYGDGITNIQPIEKLFSIGIEKVVLNTVVSINQIFIKQASSIAGSSSVVVFMDVKSKLFGKPTVFNHAGKVDTKQNPIQFAQKMQELGAG
jgi:cyclase